MQRVTRITAITSYCSYSSDDTSVLRHSPCMISYIKSDLLLVTLQVFLPTEGYNTPNRGLSNILDLSFFS